MANPSTRQELIDWCIDNKYKLWYFNIIDKALQRNWNKKNAQCYIEMHHIVPSSISGLPRNKGEIVGLTAREHFVCHLLLPKFLSGENKSKMILALHRLMHGNKKNYCKSSHTYKNLKLVASVIFSDRNKNYWNKISQEQRSVMRSGSKNSRWGVRLTEETKQKISLSNKGKLSGENHPLWKKGHSTETKKLCSINAARKALGKKWFNDGTKEFLVFPDTSLPSWQLGRI